MGKNLHNSVQKKVGFVVATNRSSSRAAKQPAIIIARAKLMTTRNHFPEKAVGKCRQEDVHAIIRQEKFVVPVLIACCQQFYVIGCWLLRPANEHRALFSLGHAVIIIWLSFCFHLVDELPGTSWNPHPSLLSALIPTHPSLSLTYHPLVNGKFSEVYSKTHANVSKKNLLFGGIFFFTRKKKTTGNLIHFYAVREG